LQRYGYAGARIKVIPWGMRIRRKLPPVHRGPVTFLFVGTDPYRKGIRLLLEAWDQLSLRNARLICFAERSVLQSHKILSYLVKHPDIEMNPILTHRRFLAMYDRVDCQILPSLEDSFSLVIADGMGAGKPAIVTEQTGIADLITHGQDGYIVPSGSVEALKEAILYCYDHPERLREMGEAAYATAKRYSWSRFRDEFLTWLDTLRE
jgi:glycosyltransferase involved in cell wall biosynthesis